MKTIPKEISDHLGEFKPCLFDGYCGEPTMWGYPVLRRLGDELWARTSEFGRMECGGGYPVANWYLITETLTPQRAVEKYGSITKVFLGPRGGYKGVIYGDKHFSSREVDPRNIIEFAPELVEITI